MLDSRIKTIASHYGLIHQLGKALEEIQELKGAIEDHLRKPSVKSKEHVVEELADVRIMLDQIVFLICAEDMESLFREFKIGRQIVRMEQENEHDKRAQ